MQNTGCRSESSEDFLKIPDTQTTARAVTLAWLGDGSMISEVSEVIDMSAKVELHSAGCRSKCLHGVTSFYLHKYFTVKTVLR